MRACVRACVTMCSICSKTLRRRQDISWHKCLPTVNDGNNRLILV